MTLRRLIGEAGGALSRRRFLAGAGAASWCAGCAGDSFDGVCQQSEGPPAVEGQPPITQAGAREFVVPESAGRIRVVYFPPPHVHALPEGLPISMSDQGREFIIDVPHALHNGAIPRSRIVLPGLWPRQPQRPAQVDFIGRCILYSLEKFVTLHQFRPPRDFTFVLADLEGDFQHDARTRFDDPRVVMERSLHGWRALAVVAHEVFHRIQYEYHPVNYYFRRCNPNKTGVERIGFTVSRTVYEGGARLAEELVLPGLNHFLDSGRGWFGGDDQRLFDTCAAPGERRASAVYASALFWNYVAEQHAAADGIAATQRTLLETIAGLGQGEATLDIIRAAIVAMPRAGEFDRFAYLKADPDVLVSSETTWGNFLVALAIHHTRPDDHRFRFVAGENWTGPGARPINVAPGRLIRFEELPESLRPDPIGGDQPDEYHVGAPEWGNVRTHAWLRPIAKHFRNPSCRPPDRDDHPVAMLAPYSMHAFRIELPGDGGNRLLRVRLTRERQHLVDALVQIVVLDRLGKLLDLIRIDGLKQAKIDRIVPSQGGREIMILVASRTRAGDYSLYLSRVARRPVVFAADWNAAFLGSYTENPAMRAWTWRGSGFAPEEDGVRLRLAVENRGTTRARKVSAVISRRRWDGTTGWTGHVEAGPIDLAAPDDCPRREALYTNADRDYNLECVSRRPVTVRSLHVPWDSRLVAADWLVRAEISCRDDPHPVPLRIHLSPGGRAPRADEVNLLQA